MAPDEKEAARRNVIEALGDVDWRGSNKTISVRVNGLDTHYMYRDLIDVVEQAGAHVDTILVPKVGVPGDIYTVDALLSQLEQAMGLSHRIGVEALVETALGMANVEAVAASSPRLEALHFGVADYAASCRARTIIHRRAQPRLSGRPVALGAVPHAGGLPCQRSAGHRRSVRGLRRSGRLPCRRPPGRGPRLRRQVGHPPLADRSGQRRVHTAGVRGGPGPPGARGAGGSRRGRPGRGPARRAHDRRRVGPDGAATWSRRPRPSRTGSRDARAGRRFPH